MTNFAYTDLPAARLTTTGLEPTSCKEVRTSLHMGQVVMVVPYGSHSPKQYSFYRVEKFTDGYAFLSSLGSGPTLVLHLNTGLYGYSLSGERFEIYRGEPSIRYAEAEGLLKLVSQVANDDSRDLESKLGSISMICAESSALLYDDYTKTPNV